MVNFCAVVGCGNKGGKENVSFYRFPNVNSRFNKSTQDLQQKRRQAWILSLNRADFSESKCILARICSIHFLSGKPADIYDSTNPDWTPSVNMGYETRVSHDRLQRYERARKRTVFQQLHTSAQQCNTSETQVEDLSETVNSALPFDSDGAGECDFSCQVCPSIQSKDTQTDITKTYIDKLHEELQKVNIEKYELQKKLAAYEMSEEHFKKDETMLTFYTGLPKFDIFMILLEEIDSYLNYTCLSRLTKFKQLLLTLMKLRLNLKFTDLAYRFGISKSSASRIFHRVLEILYQRLGKMIIWPEREKLWKTMPESFKEVFGKSIAVIIDCFEVTIEKPSNLMAKCQSWSDYKHANTIKYLIGICPQGVVTFISNGWGGRTTDKHITQECNILQKLLPGDTILADRGFNISEEAAVYFATVKTPAYTKGKNQLHPIEVESTRRIASVRIHVERVIGTVRQKYKIVFGPVPVEMLHNKGKGATIDKIVKVCCALNNICKTVVPLE